MPATGVEREPEEEGADGKREEGRARKVEGVDEGVRFGLNDCVWWSREEDVQRDEGEDEERDLGQEGRLL